MASRPAPGAVRILPSGSTGLLMELNSLEEVLERYAALVAADLPVTDIVPAGRTILVVADRGADLAALERRLRTIGPAPGASRAAGLVEIPVSYGGADLPETAASLGVSVEELVRRHQAETWTVAFCGFSPGFGYLSGSTFSWSVPRRRSPRTHVPSRAVALAGEFSAVYPRESPGGWQLIGRARVEVLDLHRDPPGLLRPGMRVRFVEEP